MSDTTPEAGTVQASAAPINPMYAGMIQGFDLIVARAAALKDKRDKASKAAGTSYLDALNKSTDSQVIDLRNTINDLLKRVNGEGGLRDQAKARLVETDELSADAAQLDTYKEQFTEARTQVRSMFNAFMVANVIPETETEAREHVEAIARPVLGQDRGRKAGESE